MDFRYQKHITLQGRYTIKEGLNHGYTLTRLAEEVEKDKTTISIEKNGKTNIVEPDTVHGTRAERKRYNDYAAVKYFFNVDISFDRLYTGKCQGSIGSVDR